MRAHADRVNDSGLRKLVADADKLAALEQHVITRSEIEAMGYEVPENVIGWCRTYGELYRCGHDPNEIRCFWLTLDITMSGHAFMSHVRRAPDLRPDTEGPLTLPIVDC
jgi:hypothetical protein